MWLDDACHMATHVMNTYSNSLCGWVVRPNRKIVVFPIPDRPSAKRAVQKNLFAKLIKNKFVSDYATDLKQNVRVKLFLLINFIDLSKIFNGWSRNVLLILSMKAIMMISFSRELCEWYIDWYPTCLSLELQYTKLHTSLVVYLSSVTMALIKLLTT